LLRHRTNAAADDRSAPSARLDPTRLPDDHFSNDIGLAAHCCSALSSLNLVARPNSLYLTHLVRAGVTHCLRSREQVAARVRLSPSGMIRCIKFDPLLRLNNASSRLKHRPQTEQALFRTQRQALGSHHRLPAVPRYELRGCQLSRSELRPSALAALRISLLRDWRFCYATTSTLSRRLLRDPRR
jgi:hypothetical protein